MGKEAERQVFQEPNMKKVDFDGTQQSKIWTALDDGDNTICESASTEDSTTSSTSWSSSSDLMEDATSSESCSSSASSSSLSNDGPLYELSELINHLPIKKGLSRYYQGKSQSFTSLASAECLEDLAKKENPYSKRLKYCKSYGVMGGADGCNKMYSPKATIQKKGTSSLRGSFPSLLGRKSGSMSSSRIQKSF